MTQYEFRNKQLIKRAAEVRAARPHPRPLGIVRAAVTGARAGR
jgi:hypothetical protein